MQHCIFCHNIIEDQILTESDHFFVVFDIDPIQKGHLIIISKTHYTDIRQIPNEILLDLITIEKKIITIFEYYFETLGIRIIQNNGKIMDKGTHFHVHLIPRYKNDNFWDNQKINLKHIDISLLKEKLNNIQR